MLCYTHIHTQTLRIFRILWVQVVCPVHNIYIPIYFTLTKKHTFFLSKLKKSFFDKQIKKNFSIHLCLCTKMSTECIIIAFELCVCLCRCYFIIIIKMNTKKNQSEIINRCKDWCNFLVSLCVFCVFIFSSWKKFHFQMWNENFSIFFFFLLMQPLYWCWRHWQC